MKGKIKTTAKTMSGKVIILPKNQERSTPYAVKLHAGGVIEPYYDSALGFVHADPDADRLHKAIYYIEYVGDKKLCIRKHLGDSTGKRMWIDRTEGESLYEKGGAFTIKYIEPSVGNENASGFCVVSGGHCVRVILPIKNKHDVAGYLASKKKLTEKLYADCKAFNPDWNNMQHVANLETPQAELRRRGQTRQGGKHSRISLKGYADLVQLYLLTHTESLSEKAYKRLVVTESFMRNLQIQAQINTVLKEKYAVCLFNDAGARYRDGKVERDVEVFYDYLLGGMVKNRYDELEKNGITYICSGHATHMTIIRVKKEQEGKISCVTYNAGSEAEGCLPDNSLVWAKDFRYLKDTNPDAVKLFILSCYDKKCRDKDSTGYKAVKDFHKSCLEKERVPERSKTGKPQDGGNCTTHGQRILIADMLGSSDVVVDNLYDFVISETTLSNFEKVLQSRIDYLTRMLLICSELVSCYGANAQVPNAPHSSVSGVAAAAAASNKPTPLTNNDILRLKNYFSRVRGVAFDKVKLVQVPGDSFELKIYSNDEKIVYFYPYKGSELRSVLGRLTDQNRPSGGGGSTANVSTFMEDDEAAEDSSMDATSMSVAIEESQPRPHGTKITSQQKRNEVYTVPQHTGQADSLAVSQANQRPQGGGASADHGGVGR